MELDFFDSRCHKNTITFAIINLFGSLLPLWLGALLLVAFSKWTTGSVFWNNGEFYLYSAALFTQSAYVLFSYKKKNYDLFSILAWVSVIVLIISAVLFSGLTTSLEIFQNEKAQFNKEFLRDTSMTAFCVSVLIFYFSSYLQNYDQEIGMRHRGEIDQIKNTLS
ncbi:MAG: hypothetical protein JXR03_06585 [Cyclobacteriaceae bacterium]